MTTVYFITHPDVVVDSARPVPAWPLSERGRARMRACLLQSWIPTINAVYCSAEQKAIDGAVIIAQHRSLSYQIMEELGENDRSATGFLPPDEFQATADQFFAHPETSIRGWETACHAQQRIVRAVDSVIGQTHTEGNIAIVSHGGVGALYLCHLKGVAISREEDQPGTSGGNYYAFDAHSKRLLHGWQPIDSHEPGQD